MSRYLTKLLNDKFNIERKLQRVGSRETGARGVLFGRLKSIKKKIHKEQERLKK